jgi:hypothetical protein
LRPVTAKTPSRANIAVVDEGDISLLLEAKREVEREYEAGKWNSIARRMVEKKSKSYDARTLQRAHKKLLEDAGAELPEDVIDHDFDSFDSD